MTTLAPWALNTTKLRPPRVTANLVVRPRLVKQMDQGVRGALTLVCASAGYGKTTLVTSWLGSTVVHGAQDDPWPVAWLSVDEYDSDLATFLRYFCAALRTNFPDACAQTLHLLSSPQQAPLNILIATLGSELAGLPKDFIFVLDDYHTIGGVEVHDLLSGLARHWPQPLHLVLITRRNPPLPLTRLRAKNELTEIRTRDLQFTTQELGQYLAEVLGQPPSAAVVAQLERQTEGWIVGLRLATLSLPRDEAAALVAVAVNDANIVEYLVNEVLSHEQPDITAFLLKTALLNRFCAPLCDAVIGDSGNGRNAQACLEWLEQTDFLIVALDHRREWYRYHHLLQDLLRARAGVVLGSDQITDLHRRAAAWFAEQGLIEEALQQAIAAGDFEQAAQLMQQALCSVLNREDATMLRHWLTLLPQEFRHRRAGLLLIEAWTFHFSFRLGEALKLVLQVETLLDGDTETLAAEEGQLLRGQVLALRAQIALLSNHAALGIPYAQEALTLLPVEWTFVRGVCMFFWGLCGQASGQGDTVERMLWSHYENAPAKSDAYALRLLGSLCFTEFQDGLLEKVRQHTALLLEQARRGAAVVVEGWAHYLLGLTYYEWNELIEAEQHLQWVIDQRYSLHSFVVREGLLSMARLQFVRKDFDAARHSLDLLSQFDIDILGYETPNTLAAWALLRYLQGDFVSAWRWADAFTMPAPDQPPYSAHDAYGVRARLLLARGTTADVDAAQALIAALYTVAEHTCNSRAKITLLALRAMTLDARHQNRAAQVALQKAIELAQPGGFIRTFVDLGPRMHALFNRMVQRGSAPEGIDHILAAFPSTVENSAQPSRAYPAVVLADPLTARELAVLRLMSQRLSAKEIAKQLGIATMTVNRHAANLYRKLGVSTRWDAVCKAEEVGLLPPH